MFAGSCPVPLAWPPVFFWVLQSLALSGPFCKECLRPPSPTWNMLAQSRGAQQMWEGNQTLLGVFLLLVPLIRRQSVTGLQNSSELFHRPCAPYLPRPCHPGCLVAHPASEPLHGQFPLPRMLLHQVFSGHHLLALLRSLCFPVPTLRLHIPGQPGLHVGRAWVHPIPLSSFCQAHRRCSKNACGMNGR